MKLSNMDLFTKSLLTVKRPVIIAVGGSNKKIGAKMITRALGSHLKIKRMKSHRINSWDLLKNNVLVFTLNDYSKIKTLFNYSRKPILAITVAGQIPARLEDDLFAAERSKVKKEMNFIKDLPSPTKLILNYDDETVRELEEKTEVSSSTFGLGKGSDFRATDVQINMDGTNFKINHEGNTVPVWLGKLFGRRQVYGSLLTCAIAQELDINLIKASKNLKHYEGIPGEGNLIEGVKNSKILDDSANADPFSMSESLIILKKIDIDEETKRGRKIAVLGDILRIGKYSVEAHETIGEKVAESSDLLFTVGSRAKFIQKGAVAHGMEKENTFHFNQVEKAGKVLEDKMEQNDLILVDGSAEMEMKKIVEEIKKR